jgi:hypothetical protein
VEERIVTTGQAVGSRVEVTSGVVASDVVVVGDLARLTDGVPVVSQ